MRGIWVFNIKKVKQVFLIIMAALFAAVIAFIQTEHIPISSSVKGPVALSKVQTEKKQLALTFDISWGDVRAEPILKYLKENKINATFFVTGDWAQTHQDIIKDMIKAGFEVESAGMKYQSYTSRSTEEVQRDILTAQTEIKKAGGEITHYLRPPNGEINKDVLKIAEKTKHQIVLWSINSKDWTNPGTDQITKNVLKRSGKGDIILLHASDSAKQTLKALPIIVEKLEDKGYTFVTLTKLISDSDVKNNMIH